MKPAATCPVCSSPSTIAFFEMHDVPVTCASIFNERRTAVEVPTGDIRLRVCDHCGFVFNADFDFTLGVAGARYESSQGGSAHFSTFARTLAEDWVERYQLRGKTVLEVGCGDAAFLHRLLECGVAGAIGIDPLAQAHDASDAIRLISDTFDERYLDVQADALVCRHTLEHISDVRAFLGVLYRWAIAGTGRAVLFELPDAHRVFAERAFWDVYYEHCSYFTEASLRTVFELAGFDVLRVARAYDDQYLIMEARAGAANGQSMALGQGRSPMRSLCEDFSRDVREAVRRYEHAITRFAEEGAPVVIWQGASKTVGFMSALSVPARQCIHCAVDVSIQRQGKFLPGTGLPVVAPTELQQVRPRHAILMNPVYLDEVTRQIRSMGLDTLVHTVNELG